MLCGTVKKNDFSDLQMLTALANLHLNMLLQKSYFSQLFHVAPKVNFSIARVICCFAGKYETDIREHLD